MRARQKRAFADRLSFQKIIHFFLAKAFPERHKVRFGF